MLSIITILSNEFWCLPDKRIGSVSFVLELQVIFKDRKFDVFVDESGNSGDAIDPSSAFSGQPSFCLVGVGERSGSGVLAGILQELRSKYGIVAVEPKGRILRRRPKFIDELVEKLHGAGCPVFVELMDKHYYLCTNITVFLFRITEHTLANLVADLLATYLSPSDLVPYAQFARNPNEETFQKFLVDLLSCLRDVASRTTGMPHCHFNKLVQITQGIMYDDRGCCDGSAVACNEFLPPPDHSGARYFALLPHVNAFTNLYARVNLVAKTWDVASVIHDEQQQFDTILQEYAWSLESNAHLTQIEAIHRASHASFDFSKKNTSLSFARSKSEAGIQIADVIAGFTAQRLTWIIRGEQGAGPSKRAVRLLGKVGVPGSGINIVSTWHRWRRFYDA